MSFRLTFSSLYALNHDILCRHSVHMFQMFLASHRQPMQYLRNFLHLISAMFLKYYSFCFCFKGNDGQRFKMK